MDGESALAQVERNQPELILLDVLELKRLRDSLEAQVRDRTTALQQAQVQRL